jgi:hypothetical protein
MLSRITLSPEDLCGGNNNEINLKDRRNRLELVRKNLKGIKKEGETLADFPLYRISCCRPAV